MYLCACMHECAFLYMFTQVCRVCEKQVEVQTHLPLSENINLPYGNIVIKLVLGPMDEIQ